MFALGTELMDLSTGVRQSVLNLFSLQELGLSTHPGVEIVLSCVTE